MEAREHSARPIEWNERPIVRVEATVMIRSDIGFTPHLGYGNSKIAIYESLTRNEYLLHGYRVQDQKVTLDFLIPQRMPFTIASPIFHHWTMGDQRMGVSFNGTADARAFDRGVRIALENLEKAHLNMSSSSRSSTSEEPTSVSPISIQSFNLSLPDDASESSFVGRPPPPPPIHQRVFSTLPIVPKFRQHALSASSPRIVPRASTSRPQRRHSSSIPGRPQRLVSHRSPPSSATELSTFPISSNRITPAVDSPFKNNIQSKKNPPSRDNHREASYPRTQQRSLGESRTKDTVFPSPSKAYSEHRPTSVSTSASRDRGSSDPQRPRRHHRPKRTKTPNLDNLERQRDMQPTMPNSYVQFASSKGTSLNGQLVQRQYLPARLGASNNNSGISYHATRLIPTQRAADTNSQKYRYHGLTTNDDSYWDVYGKSYRNSYHDSNYVLNSKQSSKLKDFPKFGSGKKKEDLGERSRCQHCQVMFNRDRNHRGSCPYAPPDRFERGVECVSCLPAARCFFYQCFRDSEGNYTDEPCTCSHYRAGMSRRRRWFILGLLSIFVPCLCLYPLLKSCHRCGVECHCCGGRHEPIPPLRDTRTNPLKR